MFGVLIVFFGGDVVRVASGQVLSRSVVGAVGVWVFCQTLRRVARCRYSLQGLTFSPFRYSLLLFFIFWGVCSVKAFSVSVAGVPLLAFVWSSSFIPCRDSLILSAII